MAASNSNTSSGSGWTRLVQSVQTNIAKKQEEARVAKEARAAGKILVDGEWQFYLLDEEWQELQNSSVLESQDSSLNTNINQEERQVADREYYDLLEVSTNADTSTIKRSYYKVARKCHPDKNPDDPEAHAKFQAVGHAYQILSNQQTRALYDKHGKQDSNSTAQQAMNEVDPMVFFNIMFGSTQVEGYIGELWLAQQTDSIMNDNGMMDPESMENMSEEERNQVLREKMKATSEKNKVKQQVREVKIARFLRNRIQAYDETNPEPFIEGCREEATKIVAGAYGALYCVTIGFSLLIAADEYLGFQGTFLGLGGHVARTRKNASGFATNMKLLGAGIRAASAGSKAMREAEDLQRATEETGGGQLDDDVLQGKMADTIDQSLPTFLEFAWAINKRDIQATLKIACQKLFDDASVPKEDRIVRARAIQILGREFESVGKQASTRQSHFDSEDIKARVAVATMTTMAKAQGQEVTEQDQHEMMQQAKEQMANMDVSAGGGASSDDDANNGGDEGKQTATSDETNETN